MEERMGLLFLIMFGAIWSCHATELANTELRRNSDLCQACEHYTEVALDYLKDNNTQNEIINILHKACSHLQFFDTQCTKLVDQYVPLLFSKISLIQPEEFCKKYNLCSYIPKISSQEQENSCGMCKDTVSAILIKLTDPDSQMEIMRALLKACNNMEELREKCKRVVFKYGPWFIVNAEKFLRTTDICTELHVCQASMIEEKPLLFDS